jgi:hypothetical protein
MATPTGVHNGKESKMNNDLLKAYQQMSDHDLLVELRVHMEEVRDAVTPIPRMRTRIRVLEVLAALALTGGGVTGILNGFVF